MNRSILIMMCPFLLFSCSQWKEKQTSGKVDDKIHYAGYFNDQTACAVGYAGLIKYSDKGGTKWKTGTNNSMCMYGMEMIDQQTFIAYGNGANVIVTKDGGATWQHATNFGSTLPGHCRYGSFVTTEMGWIANADMIGETEDFGKTWKVIDFDKKLGGIRSVSCLGPGQGYVFTSKGELYKTDNSGKDWVFISRIVDPKDIPLWTDLSKKRQTAQIRIDSADNGLFAFINETDDGSSLNIYETKDGGATWKKIKTLPSKTGSVFISPDMNYISSLNIDATTTLYSRL